MTQRLYDMNGYFEVPNNPLSRAGVFPYMGENLGDASEFEQDKVYQVYRPEEELSDPACLDSFRMLPLVDDHTMLGEGQTPAEEKGVHGTTGENVVWDSARRMILAPLRVWSKSLMDSLAGGKRELSMGYRCLYEKKSGRYNGQDYDAVQRSIRGNHIALVDRGRMGPGVAVLDSLKFAYDHLEVTIETKDADTMTPEQVKAAIDAALKPITDSLQVVTAKMAKDAEEAMAEKKADEEKAAADKKAADDLAAIEAAKEDDKDKKGMDTAIKAAVDAATKALQDKIIALEARKPGMDAKDMMSVVARRNALAERLSFRIGTFDHSQMSEDEVVKYGIETLGITAEAGHERSALDGFLQAQPAVVMDGFMTPKAGAGKSQIDAALANQTA